MLRISGGDARKLFNAIELVVNMELKNEIIEFTNDKVLHIVQQNLALYDKGGEMHYDVISAFIKSMRGSDPNATVYYLARMIAGGEDPKFIARRMLILASEENTSEVVIWVAGEVSKNPSLHEFSSNAIVSV